ncbi:MAG TPA: hypothetical protein VE842_04935 [Pyrinomonadaceae bacterium]|nr:hypothetical protein [Pyrinomonadaceae bacterium]
MEIAESGSFDRSFKTDHQLTALPSCALRVKDKLVVGRVLPQALEDFKRPDSQRYKTRFIVLGFHDEDVLGNLVYVCLMSIK